ncbi:MAG: efflux RND transporter periplasmic adaptor subunit [Fusobacteriaceae bacterium]|nr:efflux RND transporter periplasmic adaptor subunit [Fusobacteriaceae bacterium]
MNKIKNIVVLMVLFIFSINSFATNSVVTIAKIEGAKSVEHSSDEGGKIVKIYHQNGDVVKKGDVILTIQNDTVSSYLKQAESQYLMAKSNFDKTKKFSKDQQMLNLKRAEKNLIAAKMNLQKSQNGTKQEQIDQIKFNLEASKYNYETLKKNYDKNKALYQKNSISEQSFLQIENQYKAAENSYKSSQKSLELAQKGSDIEDIKSLKASVDEAQVTYNITNNMINQQIWNYDINVAQQSMNSAKAVYDLAKIKSGNLAVVAECSGVLSGLKLDEGNKVTSGKTIFSVMDTGTMQVKALISAKEIGNVKKNATVDIFVAVLNKHFTGYVYNIGQVADSKTKKYEVKIRITNSTKDLKEGMFGKITIKK